MTCNSKISGCSSTSPNYTYPASGSGSVRPHAVYSAGTNSYLYDRNGNMIQNAGRSITYDPYNRPVSITSGTRTTAYAYDGIGSRVKKIEAGATTIYIGNLYECINGSCSKHIFAGDQRIAIKPVGVATDIKYFHPDHLGSSNVITDVNGAKVGSLAYYPYGQTRVDTAVNYKFNSKEQDKNTALGTDTSTSLYFYGARYYDPVIGRFISADPIVPNARDPQAFNRYAYVRNNPILYSDPSGHSWFSKHRRQIFDVGLQMFGGPIGISIGTYDLSKTKSGRNILAGEIVIGTAAATVACGGCGVGVGALAGELTGAYSAHRAGGDIFRGVVVGGIAGGSTAYLAGGINTETGSFWAQVEKNFGAGFIKGAAFGGINAYAGGKGDSQSILRGAIIGGTIYGSLSASKVLIFGANVTTDTYVQSAIAKGEVAYADNFSGVTVREGGLLPTLSGADGVTVGNTISLQTGMTTDQELLLHELFHVQQYASEGGIVPFLTQYIAYSLEYGYRDNPYEQVAYTVSRRLMGP